MVDEGEWFLNICDDLWQPKIAGRRERWQKVNRRALWTWNSNAPWRARFRRCRSVGCDGIAQARGIPSYFGGSISGGLIYPPGRCNPFPRTHAHADFIRYTRTHTLAHTEAHRRRPRLELRQKREEIFFKFWSDPFSLSVRFFDPPACPPFPFRASVVLSVREGRCAASLPRDDSDEIDRLSGRASRHQARKITR